MKHSAMKKLSIVLAVVIISFECSAALTLTIDSYSVSRNAGDPALALDRFSYILPANSAYSFELEKGESKTISFFSVGTSENYVNNEGGIDDTTHRPISISLNMSQSSENFSLNNTGVSYGIVSTDRGYISWNVPVEVNFGYNNMGILRLDMHDNSFGCPGSCTISGTITLVEVPEVTTLSLLALGALPLLRKRKP